MEDTQIFRIALITAVIGLAGMMLLSGKILPPEVKIKELNKGMVGEEVSIEGTVVSIDKSQRSETYFLQIIEGASKTTLVIFDDTVLGLEKNSLTPYSFLNRRVKITGKVAEYNEHIELILKDANSIKILA